MDDSRVSGRHLAPALIACAIASASPAAQLTIDRLFDAPALNGPTIVGLQVSPDGSRVTFLQGNAENKDTVEGIFQLQFDREIPCQLVRVTLPPETELFPEISGSQHRCTIRFLNWTDAVNRPVHVDKDVPFLLTCCA